MALLAYLFFFIKKSYFKYLATGFGGHMKAVPVTVYEYVLHVPDIGYD